MCVRVSDGKIDTAFSPLLFTSAILSPSVFGAVILVSASSVMPARGTRGASYANFTF